MFDRELCALVHLTHYLSQVELHAVSQPILSKCNINIFLQCCIQTTSSNCPEVPIRSRKLNSWKWVTGKKKVVTFPSSSLSFNHNLFQANPTTKHLVVQYNTSKLSPIPCFFTCYVQEWYAPWIIVECSPPLLASKIELEQLVCYTTIH
jgi:hypothetical protein